MRTVRRNNKVGISGISVYKGGYRVQYTRNGQYHYVGVYKTLEEASEALERAKEKESSKTIT